MGTGSRDGVRRIPPGLLDHEYARLGYGMKSVALMTESPLMDSQGFDYWSIDESLLINKLETSLDGLSDEEVERRRTSFGPNRVSKSTHSDSLTLFLSQFKSPITLLLLGAVILSAFLRDRVDAAIILVIVIASAFLGFIQERGAAQALAKLLSMISVRASVRRNKEEKHILTDDIVPGDILLLTAGATIPADARLLTSNNLFVNEASFTGETFPVEKTPSLVAADSPASKRSNVLLSGTCRQRHRTSRHLPDGSLDGIRTTRQSPQTRSC